MLPQYNVPDALFSVMVTMPSPVQMNVTVSEPAATQDTVVADVAWSYADPLPESTQIKGFLSFDAAKVDLIAELPESSLATSGFNRRD